MRVNSHSPSSHELSPYTVSVWANKRTREPSLQPLCAWHISCWHLTCAAHIWPQATPPWFKDNSRINLFQHVSPKKPTGCHDVLTQIILLATVCVSDTKRLQPHFSVTPLIPDTEAPCQRVSLSTSDDTVSPERSTHKAKATSTFHWKRPQF